MVLVFSGEVVEWRGPAPFLFVRMPPESASEVQAMSAQLTYGWGCIPVAATIGETECKTSLFPKDGGYLVPVKLAVQRAEGVGVGSTVAVRLEFRLSSP